MEKVEYTLPLALTPKKTLIVGAGKIAKQKHRILSQFCWDITVIAKEIADEYFVDINVIRADILKKDFTFLQQFEVIICASGKDLCAEFLWQHKKKCGFLLNVVDKPHWCDFYFGALAHYGNVNVMVSSNGASPIVSQTIRDKIARLLPRNIADFAQKLKIQRKNNKPNKQQQQEIYKQTKEVLGKVVIVGCGPCKLDNLTLRALEALEWIEVALVDNLVGKEIVELLERMGIECIDVGKQKGKHNFLQEEINNLMLHLAKEGKCVGRLKGGDPAVFGRIYEEVEFLRRHEVEVEVIGGISSSLNGALSSGIVPTLRGVSSGIAIVSAHLKENLFNAQWLEILRNHSYTLIVMMAYSFAAKITESAKEMGIKMEIPAAFVSKVDMPEQKSVIGTLGKLEEMAKMCEKPAILILGDAVAKSFGMPYRGQRIFLT